MATAPATFPIRPRDSFADHLDAPRGRGELRGSPFTGAAGGAACGDLVRLSLEIDAGRIVAAGFDAKGCAAAVAAGSATVELAEGREALEVARVGPADVAGALGGLDSARRHAADLAADALHRALGAAAGAGAVRLTRGAGRVLVAMGGGVDSAVAAHLAARAGHEVVAVTLELWADPAGDGAGSCCSPQAVTGARGLAQAMGLPHLTLDRRSRFADRVVADFISEHVAGRTPNPCVRCNAHVRFDALLGLLDFLGGERLVTGHYARVGRDDRGPLLRAAVDSAKDQTYMLAGLRPDALDRLWFPLGELTKPHVRDVARSAGLAVAEKPESQDLCFLAGTRREDFLARHGRAALSGGEIVDRAGRVLGRHDGQERFTVGQRRGLGVAAGEPLYVLAKDARSGQVTVGPRSALATSRVRVRGARLHRDGREVDRVKLRYRARAVACRLKEELPAGDHAAGTLVLDRPVDGVAPGQTACLMRGDSILGWARIADPGRPALV